MPRFRLPAAWPAPADRSQASQLAGFLFGPDGSTGPADSAKAALVACLGGNSPYLADLVRREPACFDLLCRRGPDAALAGILASLDALPAGQPGAAIARALRQAKRQVALVSAVADIGGLWSLEQVTGSLSRLAETALSLAVRHLLMDAARRGELRQAGHQDAGSGFVVLGMGKLGARELNYSSDIDLVLLYDPDAHPGHDELQRVFTRLSAELVRLMETRDADGYVFRMDLRLRPDPGSTPPAVSLPTAVTYYESLGQTWERAALTKARPVAGDLALGWSFLSTIGPFIWRRHLDFAAIEDIVAMKRRIDRHRGAAGRPPLGTPGATQADEVAVLLGHDLKLGHGGIREIEFLAQTMLLVWGGRAPELRDATTLGALERLAEGSYLPAGLASDLAATYRLLRTAEHRLQMRDDRQTHSLPGDRGEFDRFALFMDCEGGGEALARRLLEPMRRVHAAFGDMFATGPAGREPEPFCHLDAPDLASLLGRAGFAQPARAAAILGGWRDRHLRALRSDRAQRLLRDILPGLLAALLEQQDPMLALIRFDSLLARQSTGVQLLSLLAHNAPLLGRIAGVLGAAPFLADHLAAVPSALEGLLVPEEDGENSRRRRARLAETGIRSASGVEEAIARARTLVRGEEFRFSLAQLDGRLDTDRAGIARSDLADHVIGALLEVVLRAHRSRYGEVRGGGMVVVALGKAGSREMMAGSDLDLMLVYDHPPGIAESMLPKRDAPGVHRRALPVSQYYIRLAHAVIAALSAPGLEGPLYALDMRLRPSGSKGPVAVSLAAFRRYHAEQAWTWERMALTRARVVAGPAALRRAMRREIAQAVTGPGAGGEAPGVAGRRRTLQAAAAMRARVADERPARGSWDIKLLEGGLLEVEFIAQVLQLVRPEASPHQATRLALRSLARSGTIGRAQAMTLVGADRFWRDLQSMLRILFGTQVPEAGEAWTPPVREALLQGLRPLRIADLDALRAHMRTVASSVRAAFVELVVDAGAQEP
ncbi:bifunctional [glutamine synthetase] adenylyltransferase/[glutamine synthetase]-adenylyl-L-tyrosine phosphorylase [Lichenicoccus roseus]|uniref:bifunctional [glutamine synthetase] adenylyltransferase/[glutamine synthetase]-adenylyl-L-tyrosine phosphorylase n=1 Tax=Lichenicoccus roseus TaxID=2683649 RepID=UPI001485FFCD|nr:bifunctional [glutamine synthetase] adenylyltransferase/[glutamine synthetase]-adenylyl-L-tyrosine phosphorylase [Lichenicoccus roseus]